jgi:cobalt/nickel transport system permease protein
MRLALLTHHHSYGDSPVHGLQASVKLSIALLLILGTVLMPPAFWGWFGFVGATLLAGLVASRLPPGFVIKRLVLLSPFVLGVALVNAGQPHSRLPWQMLALKSSLCLITVILLANTTPFSEILRVLQRVRVPHLLITTLALMHRYLFVLGEESERMRRARLSRTFSRGGRFQWGSLATVIGQLFIRASERAERIYDAMCSRGWK